MKWRLLFSSRRVCRWCQRRSQRRRRQQRRQQRRRRRRQCRWWPRSRWVPTNIFSWSWSWRLNFEPESIRCLHLEQKSLKTQSSFFPFLIWKLKPRLRLKNDRSLRRLLMILPETTSSGWRSPELTCYETCPWLGGRAVWGFSNTCDWTNARLLATLSSQRCHQLSTALHNCRAVKKQNFLMARPGQRCQTN